MLKQETVTISGDEYMLTQFTATKGIRYQKKLAKIVLPALAEIVKNNEGQEQNTFAKIIEKVWENLDELDEDFIKELVVNGATKKGVTINFDFEFAGDYVRLFELVKAILKFNFESVFQLVGSNVL